MMEEADFVRSQTQAASILSATISLSGRCRTLIYELEQWHRLWLSCRSQPLCWLQPSKIYKEVDNDGPGKGIPMALHFADLETAHLENHYWASLLLIHATFWLSCVWVTQSSLLSAELSCNIEDEISGDDVPRVTHGLPTLAPLTEIHAYAMNIAQSLEFFLQPKLGDSGSSLIGFPLMVAMGYFKYFQLPELSWFNTILGKFQSLGIPLEQFLDGMANEEIATLVRE